MLSVKLENSTLLRHRLVVLILYLPKVIKRESISLCIHFLQFYHLTTSKFELKRTVGGYGEYGGYCTLVLPLGVARFFVYLLSSPKADFPCPVKFLFSPALRT